jgi:signal transduction histidine kinase
MPVLSITTPSLAPGESRGPLGWIERARPSPAVDVALAATLGLALQVAFELPIQTLLASVVLVAAPVAFRRVQPVLLLAVVAGGIVATESAGGGIGVVAFAILAYTAGASPGRSAGSLPLVAAVSILLGIALIAMDAETWAIVAPTFVAVPAWLAGDVVRAAGRARLARAEAAAAAERERERHVRETVAEERRAMARELHDIVAHGVSVMTVQAGAAREVVLDRPDIALESLDAIRTTGREAMTELRRLLDVLAEDAGSRDVPAGPQPTLERLPELVERIRAAGLSVELVVEGTPHRLPAAVDLVAYRVVQEALTNSLRHAAGVAATVRLGWRADDLKVEILDDGPAEAAPQAAPGHPERSPGRGLTGLRDRVAQVGGRFEAGPRLGGGFAVRAWLPTRHPTATS